MSTRYRIDVQQHYALAKLGDNIALNRIAVQ